MSILNALNLLGGVTIGPQLMALGMAPSVKRGDFKDDEVFQIGQSEIGQGEFFKDQDFNKGYVSSAPIPVNEPLVKGGIIDAAPIFASEDIAARKVGVPQDTRFTGIMKNAVARPLLFKAGANLGLTGGQILTGAVNPLFALAGAIGSQFLPLGRSKPDMDYQYVNDPNNMGGLRLSGDGKIIDPSGILSGKNFESAFGSKNLGEMYDKEIGRLDDFITDLEEEDNLTDKQKSRLDRLTEKRQIARNRLQDYLMSTQTIEGTNMTRGQFARDYNQGIGQFAQPDYDALDQQSYTQDLGGGEFTDSMGNVDYSDPYDPGGGE
mgnify:CR=1 FL=1|tara:strand:- start:1495 stop:2457 length:963 start_codon:yes stop_codon:yes gene_type:complete